MVGPKVHGLGVVVTPGGEGVVPGALAGAAVHLDLDTTDLGRGVQCLPARGGHGGCVFVLSALLS